LIEAEARRRMRAGDVERETRIDVVLTATPDPVRAGS
jgi:hypothetical protein